jgi:purine-binding chemotaxis protein CheW
MTTASLDGTAERSASTDRRQLVVFLLGSEEYAVGITSVQEIIRYTTPRPMPGAASGVEGVINLRGKIIPVVDLRRVLGSHGERASESKIVVVDVGETTLGMEVDEVSEVLTVDAADCEPAPEGVAVGAGADVIESVVKLDGRLLVTLNLDRLFAGASAY